MLLHVNSLGYHEAYLNGEKIGKKGKDALFALLNKLSELSKEVQDITYETIDGKQVEVILYNNNSGVKSG